MHCAGTRGKGDHGVEENHGGVARESVELNLEGSSLLSDAWEVGTTMIEF